MFAVGKPDTRDTGARVCAGQNFSEKFLDTISTRRAQPRDAHETAVHVEPDGTRVTHCRERGFDE